MYQALIWVTGVKLVTSNDARGLRTSFYAEDRKGLTDPLVDGVRRDMEFCRNLLGAEMLIDETQAIELTGA